VFGGTAIQYAVMPLLAFVMGKTFGLADDAFIGIVVVGCVPGAMASNVLTLNARGNTSYSVSLTTTATLLSPIAVPFVLALALQSSGVDVGILKKTSRMLMITVVTPVLAGHLLSRRYPKLEKHSRKYGALIANLAILWIIAVVVAMSKSRLKQLQFDLLGALLAVNVLGYVAGYCGGWGMRLPEPMRRALTLEVGMQNAGLGAALALTLFPGQPGVAIAPAIYTFGCMLTGTMLAHAWARVSERDETADGRVVSEP
jgi:BASS family bile acid:Na+ symporter